MAKSHVANEFALRKGDGVVIDVVQQRSIQTAGDTQISYGMNLNEAPVPSRRYVADVANVLVKHGAVQLLFGQEKVGGDELRSILAIHLSSISAHNLLNSFDVMRATLDRMSDPEDSGKLTLIREGSAQAVAFSASGCACAVANFDACMDFYSISPFSVRSVQIVKKVAVEPVVRVDLRAALLAGIVSRLDELVKDLPSAGVEGE